MDNKQNKAILSKALQRANTATLLDNQLNFEGALSGYREACKLLEKVVTCTDDPNDKRKLDGIRLTYSARIDELHRPEIAQTTAGAVDVARTEVNGLDCQPGTSNGHVTPEMSAPTNSNVTGSKSLDVGHTLAVWGIEVEPKDVPDHPRWSSRRNDAESIKPAIPLDRDILHQNKDEATYQQALRTYDKIVVDMERSRDKISGIARQHAACCSLLSLDGGKLSLPKATVTQQRCPGVAARSTLLQSIFDAKAKLLENERVMFMLFWGQDPQEIRTFATARTVNTIDVISEESDAEDQVDHASNDSKVNSASNNNT